MLPVLCSLGDQLTWSQTHSFLFRFYGIIRRQQHNSLIRQVMMMSTFVFPVNFKNHTAPLFCSYCDMQSYTYRISFTTCKSKLLYLLHM